MPRRVEVSGATVEQATLRALEQLQVAPHEAHVEVLRPARRSLFGNTRSAHVRVTVRGDDHPRSAEPAPTEDQENDVPNTDMEQPARTSEVLADEEEELTPQERMDQRDEEADLAADFVEGLLDRLDLPGDIEIAVHEEQALVNVTEVGSGLLIGRRGATLDALQELVRCAVQRQTERRSHVRVDVEGYRARQLDKLRDKCRDAIAQVRESGEPVRLEPMDAYERKMMHDLVAKTGGVSSTSEGTEPKRRVVIHPDTD